MSIPDGAFPVNDPSLVGDPVSLEVIDAGADPEYANARSDEVLQQLNPLPEIDAAPDGTVHLPAGWIDPQGKLHTTALVRELTGADEEKLARVSMRENFPLWIRTLLECGVEYIGDQPASQTIFDQLLVGDREMLILGIRVATYGNELPMDITCPSCDEVQAIALELDADIPIKKLDPPEVREFDLKLKHGEHAVVHLTTAAVQDEVISDRKRTGAEMATLTVERCTKTIDGNPVNHHMALEMKLADRKTIMDFLADTQPGPDYEGVSLPCSSCGREFPVRLSMVDLFRS